MLRCVQGQARLLKYFDYPAEHWKHLRTTNPIESTFATVRLREGVTKGAGSRTAALAMAFKLLQIAQGALAHARRHGIGAAGPPELCSRTARVWSPSPRGWRGEPRRPPPDLGHSTTI